mmetsp:Transcript_16679/g.51782  ORF Transcript_16679/g.51782 Transcript_16679/m.51782 type:complete len:219 (-) Transcript_16679:519-1175(-)
MELAVPRPRRHRRDPPRPRVGHLPQRRRDAVLHDGAVQLLRRRLRPRRAVRVPRGQRPVRPLPRRRVAVAAPRAPRSAAVRAPLGADVPDGNGDRHAGAGGAPQHPDAAAPQRGPDAVPRRRMADAGAGRPAARDERTPWAVAPGRQGARGRGERRPPAAQVDARAAERRVPHRHRGLQPLAPARVRGAAAAARDVQQPVPPRVADGGRRGHQPGRRV